MWDENPLLRAWYSGQSVNFGNNEFQQPDIRAISIDDLISNFKTVLSSRTPYVIKAMWDKNERLHNAIRDFKPWQSKYLLKKVMSNKSNVITDYVNWLDNASTIRAVLEDYRNKKLSTVIAKKIGLLQNRLEMLDASRQDTVTNPSDSLITTNNSNQLITVPIPTNQSKKRKALPEAISSRGKKQRTEVIESELSNLVKQMPALLSGQTFFGVEQAVGLDLKKLPKTTQDELGIGSIRKVQNQTQYTVQISDSSKYRDAYNKYTAPLFVTAANTNNPLYSQNQSTELLNYNAMESNHKIDGLISTFKSTLSGRRSDVTKAMWDENPLLRAWYSGQPVNFGNNQFQQLDMRVISFDELINNFKSALSGRKSDVTKAMWDENPLLRAWYSGQPVNFGNNQFQQPDIRAISLDDLINNFKSALSSRTAYVIKAMWDENPLLQRGIADSQLIWATISPNSLIWVPSPSMTSSVISSSF